METRPTQPGGGKTSYLKTANASKFWSRCQDLWDSSFADTANWRPTCLSSNTTLKIGPVPVWQFEMLFTTHEMSYSLGAKVESTSTSNLIVSPHFSGSFP